MKKLDESFFEEGRVILIGYSSNEEENSYSRLVYSNLVEIGLEVYVVNYDLKGDYNIPVHKSALDIDHPPSSAIVLTDEENHVKMIKELEAVGVKNILIKSKRSISEDVAIICDTLCIDVYVGSPLMLFGNGIQKIYGRIIGV